MEVVKRAKERFRKYPALVAECRELGAQYATCVLSKRDVKKDDCKEEFEKFKACLLKAAARNKTRL
ncbi:uncharacterized protein LOC106638053 [Copidosoma floridanum]|uniref:uncharacterized protein LOC106638053 n=1 Tax=Copidosoma floridanum TaxID=29053 RepID=UPI0006C97D6C|nr:uncharacterized protein LOC106638053 [Copidosoma floridanum]